MRRLRSSSIKSREAAFLALLVCLFSVPAFGQPWDGNGVEGDPYLIYDACDMQAIGADANYWDAHFILCADINLGEYTGTSFNIIGNGSARFTGIFDGNEHTVSNFTYLDIAENDVGLFGRTGSSSEIKNIHLEDVNITGDYCVGSLVGLNEGLVSNCSITGTVSGCENIGGLVGMAETSSSIVDSTADVTINICDDYGFAAGGLVGHNFHGNISNCSASGSVKQGIDTYYSGGLIGFNEGSVTDCFATCNVSGYGMIGGLIGNNGPWGHIESCYATGNVLGNLAAGGLIGRNYVSVLNCYAMGNVTEGEVIHFDHGKFGGLVGWDCESAINCYSTGQVSGTGIIGAFVGAFDDGEAYTGCFWNSDVNPDVNGIGDWSDPNVIGKTTAEMRTASTFTDAGWDFVGEVINGPNDVWTICEGEDYPRLAWEKYGGGNGTEANPYLIRTSCQMNAIGADSNDWGKDFRLMADIDLGGYTGAEYNIIGNYDNPFTGVFDGNDHTISNFTYESDGVSPVGLFGCVDDVNAEIKDLGLIAPDVNAGTGARVGSLVGSLDSGIVANSYVEDGSVEGLGYIGGLVGYNFFGGTVSKCYSSATVSGESCVGGLVGEHAAGSVASSYCTGIVSGDISVGGLVGKNRSGGTISDCYSVASVSGNSEVGGLVGTDSGYTVSNCYSAGSVSGTTDVGGLVGFGTSVYTKCFWDVNVNPDVNGVGYDGSDPNVIGKTTAEMQTKSTFTDAGWDFVGEIINGPNDIWDICEGTNYPKFVWQIPAADFVCPDGVNFIDYAFFARYWLQAIYGDCGKVELTGDGKVNWVDFALFAEYWKLTGCGECGGADFTGDENVDLADLYVFATYWLGFEYAEVDLTNDGQVDLDDLREFTENWLAGF